MSLWKIAWRTIQYRSLSSGLTAFSMGLGVALVVAVLVIHSVVDQSFRRGAGGYDLVVGAQGSPMELVLSTVYYMDPPEGTIPESYVDEIQSAYADEVDLTIPLAMAGAYKGFPVVGTTPELFEEIEYQPEKKYTFSSGRNIRYGAINEQGDFVTEPYTAVVGSTAAQKCGLQVGDEFRLEHGTDVSVNSKLPPYKIVGVLGHTGTPNDRAIFINIEGFHDMHAHDTTGEVVASTRTTAGDAHADEHADEQDAHEEDGEHSEEADPHAGHDHAPGEPCPYEDHAEHGEEGHVCGPGCTHGDHITAILVVLNEQSSTKDAVERWIEEDLDAQAVYPSEHITKLFDRTIGNVQWVLLMFAVLVIIVAGIGMMVSIYNSMSERRHEIAVMRALGARRATVMAIILLESILLSLGGGALGVFLGHLLIAVVGPNIAEQTGVLVDPLHFQWVELVLIPGLIALASVVGYLPAVVAYRTEVAESLGE